MDLDLNNTASGPVRLSHSEYQYRGGYDNFNEFTKRCIRTEIVLLKEGTFTYHLTKTIFLQDKSINTSDTTVLTGTWEINKKSSGTAHLILQFSDGNILQLSVSYQQGKGIMLDEKRFAVDTVNNEALKEKH